MKKRTIIIVIITVVIMLCSVWVIRKREKTLEDQPHIKVEETEKEESYDAMSTSINNTSFYHDSFISLNATLTYYNADSTVVHDGMLNMKLVKNYEKGDLFKLSILNDKNIQKFLSEDRLNIYFYVTDNEIYRLWSYICKDEEVIYFYNDDELLIDNLDTDEKLIANGELVYSEKDVDDELLASGSIQTTITHKNNQTFYNRIELNEDGSMHYYESFVWEVGRGLVEYKSGFNAESDIFFIENVREDDSDK